MAISDQTEIEKILRYGDKLYDEGNIDQAKETYAKVVTLGYVNKDFKTVVDACLRLGPIFSRQSDYPNMIKAYENALLVTKTYKLRAKEPTVYKRLGDGYWRVGAISMAKQYYDRCEEVLGCIESESEKKYLMASLYIDGYGNLLDEQGRFREAIKYYKKSLEILDALQPDARDERSHIYFLYATYNIGVAFERRGMSQERLGKHSKKWFREAVKHFEQVRDLCDHTTYEYAISTLDAGYCYSKLSMIPLAEKYTDEALRILSKPSINAKDLVAWGHMNRGVIARKKVDFEAAILYFNKAIELYDAIGIHEWISMVYSELAETYRQMGEEDKAQEALRRSRDVSKPEKEHVAVTAVEEGEPAD